MYCPVREIDASFEKGIEVKGLENKSWMPSSSRAPFISSGILLADAREEKGWSRGEQLVYP